MANNNFLEKVKAVVLGHAVADALGVPVEFCSRETLEEEPVTDMTGYGTYNVPAGSWSDDTSMSLCAIGAIVDGKLYLNMIATNFVSWYYLADYTPGGRVFDVGLTCDNVIRKMMEEGKLWDECGETSEYSNGNGSLMRIHPVALYAYRLNEDVKTKIEMVEKASAITHAHARSKIACGIYAFILWRLLDGQENAVALGLNDAMEYYKDEPELAHYKRLLSFADIQTVKNTPVSEINSSGYVVDTFESALWCLLTTESYADCVLKAVNLGKDTDTVGAIAGGLAGALYGYDAIPKKWLDTLIKRDYIEELCSKAYGENK